MVIVGNKLKRLITKTKLAPVSAYDNTCIQLRIDRTVAFICNHHKKAVLTYGTDIPDYFVEYKSIETDCIVLYPKETVLASSAEEINMPLGYAGFLQTKGSLARLMVSIHFSDGQVDPGFLGHITFELFNASNNVVAIPLFSPVGNLYIVKTRGIVHPYDGKYSRSSIPTMSKQL